MNIKKTDFMMDNKSDNRNFNLYSSSDKINRTEQKKTHKLIQVE